MQTGAAVSTHSERSQASRHSVGGQAGVALQMAGAVFSQDHTAAWQGALTSCSTAAATTAAASCNCCTTAACSGHKSCSASDSRWDRIRGLMRPPDISQGQMHTRQLNT